MKIMTVAVLALAVLSAPLAYADQPHMRDALASLKDAKKSLEMASEDKGGNRVKAIKAINEAIEYVEAGIRFDKTHISPNENMKH